MDDAFPAGLRRQAVELAFAAGEVVFRLGARPARMFWVLEGEVRLVRHSRSGADIVLQRAYGGFVAEASLESPRYHCDALAALDSRLLGFPIAAFRQALRHDVDFRAFWMGRLAREVRLLRSQCERLALRSAAERIEHYIEAEGDNGRLELARSRKAWAAELGLTHEALYRALAGLRRSGRLSTARSAAGLVLTLRRAP
jgi:CRP/FNR family transcriptional regulator, dissimilatory nitrate respiration regulator